MASFEIPDIPLVAALKPGQEGGVPVNTGSVAFTITNKAPTGLTGRISLLPQGDAKAEWFSIDGETDRPFPPGGTHSVTVRIRVPAGTGAARHAFKVQVVNVNATDGDFTESPTVVFDIAAPPPPRPPPPRWLIPAIAAAVVLIAAVAGGLYLHLRPVYPPDVVGQGLEAASKTLADAGYTLHNPPVTDTSSDRPSGEVVAQAPRHDQTAPKGSEVTLTVAGGAVVPDVLHPARSYENAEGFLGGLGFVAARTDAPAPTGVPPGTVVAQDPAAGTRAAAGTRVTLTIDPGLTMPKLVDRPLDQALKAMDAGGLKLDASHSNQVAEAGAQVVTAQTVAAGTVVAGGTPVGLTWRVAPPAQPPTHPDPCSFVSGGLLSDAIRHCLPVVIPNPRNGVIIDPKLLTVNPARPQLDLRSLGSALRQHP